MAWKGKAAHVPGDDALRHFLVCAQTLSFTRAAERLRISQPALSQKIAKLETSVNAQLFERTTRGLKLTRAGKRLRDELAEPFARIDQVLASFLDAAGVRQDEISMASVHTLYSYLLPHLLQAFSAEHPDVSFQMRAGSSQEVVKLVTDGSVDFGILYGNLLTDERVDTEHLYTERIVAAFSEDIPQASSLLNHRILPVETPLLLFPRAFALRRLVDRAFRGEVLNIRAEIDTLDAMLSAATLGLGVCMVPECVPVASRFPNMRTVSLANPPLRREVVLVRRPRFPPRPLLASFLHAIRDAATRLDTP
ncbi:LysR family transcriptional regulator [Arhodomonas sp. AD133]|uniref:LysR family transcriptional regulator n=1 Tax=Arhodomonas sp. AD133 TaxID=3415009 RepID=UPI003EBEA62C